MRNLALSPLDSGSAVFDAIENGTCDFGLVSHGVAVSSTSRFGDGAATFVVPQPAYASIEGIGVARHARNPESAQLFVDWLLSAEVQRRHALGVLHYSSRDDQLGRQVVERISRQNIAQAGWLDEDARLLAERAGYR